jgi:hypothetical protein
MHTRWLTLVLVSTVALAACSSDKKKSNPPATKDAGTDSGPSDSGSTVPTDSGSTAMTIMCGTKSCTAPTPNLSGIAPDGGSIGGFMITPDLLAMFGFGPMVCCTPKNLCGVTQSMLIPDGTCVEQTQTGKPDKACPNESTTVMGFPIPLNGCCKPNNKCGVDLGILGVGCLERTEASKLGMMAPPTDGGMPLPTYKAIACSYTGGSTDAGTDAGPGNDSGSADAN